MHKLQDRAGAQLEQIEAFVAVAELGGFTAAARALGRDASVIARRLDALEARLGVRLLSRTTRRVAVTEVGAEYLPRVRAILAEVAMADTAASEGAAEPRGLLRLSLSATFARNWIVPWLPAFMEAYPQIQIELHHGDRFVDLVAEGFDAAIRIGALPDSQLTVRHLANFETILCASPRYIAARGVPTNPEDLEQHACVGLNHPLLWPEWRLRRGEERVAVRVRGQMVSDDGASMVLACLHGAGIILSSEWSIGRHVAAGRLVRVLPDWRFDYQGAAQFVLPPGRLVPAKTRVFIDRLKEEFTPIAPWHRPEDPGGF
jgi:DNA-binding transcriptional LysR family regulator